MTPEPPEVPETAIKTPKGRYYWGGRVARRRYAYWIKFGDGPDELFHIDAVAEFKTEEIDSLTDYLLWASEARKKGKK